MRIQSSDITMFALAVVVIVTAIRFKPLPGVHPQVAKILRWDLFTLGGALLAVNITSVAGWDTSWAADFLGAVAIVMFGALLVAHIRARAV